MDATIIGRIAVKVVPDTDGFKAKTQADLNKIEHQLGPLKIDLKAETAALLRQAKDAIHDAQDHADRNKVRIQFETDETSLRDAQARIGVVARNRDVDLFTRINEASAAKASATLAALAGTRSVGNIFESFKDLDKAVPKIATVSLALADLTSFSASGVSNVAALVGSLTSIAPAALALPGIFGGLALGVGASIAVLKDFNDVLPGVGKRFEKLQDSMSVTFWDKAKEPFRGFIDEIFPQFAAGMDVTSSALGDFFANLADSGTGVFDGQLDSMFKDLGESIQIAGKYTDNFLGIIEKLGSLGAGNLPRLAGWIGDIGASFDGWLEDTGQNGLQAYVDAGIVALQDLGSVLGSTGSVLKGFYTAAEAAGGSTLAILSDTMAQLAKDINSDKVQGQLTGVFTSAHEAIEQITNGSGPAFTSLLDRIANLLQVVLPSAGKSTGKALSAIFSALDQDVASDAIAGAFASIDKAIDNLAPSLPGVVKGLAGIIDVAGALAESISATLGTALGDLGPKVAEVADVLLPVISALGDFTELIVGVVGGALSALPPSLLVAAAGFVGLSLVMGKVSAAATKMTGSVQFANAAFKVTSARQAIPTLQQLGTALQFAGQSAQYQSEKTKAANAAVRGIAGPLGKAALGAGALALAFSPLPAKVGLSNTAMLGVAGSMAGPFGAAIGASIGLIVDLGAASKSNQKAIDSFTDSLKSTDMSKVASDFSTLRKQMQDMNKDVGDVTGVMDALGEVGMGVTDLLGTGFQDINRASDESIAQLTNLTTVLGGVAKANGDYVRSFSENGQNFNFGNLEDLTRIATAAGPVLEDLGITLADIANVDSASEAAAMVNEITAAMDAAASTAGKTEAVSEAIGNIGSAAGGAADEANSLKAAMDALLSPALNAEEATDAWRASLTTLRTEMNATAGFKGFTEAAQANRETSRQYVADTTEMLAARAAAGASTEQVAALVQKSRDQFIAEGIAAGFTSSQITKRANAMGLTPELVATIFEANGLVQSSRQVNVYQGLLAGLPKGVKTEIRTNGAPSSMAQVRALKKQYDLTPEQVTTLITVLKADKAKTDVDKSQKAVKLFGTTVGEAKIGIEDKATAPTEKAKGKTDEFGRVNAKATLSVVDNATSVINSVRAALDSLSGKTATTYIKTVRTGGGGGGGGDDIAGGGSSRLSTKGAGNAGAALATSLIAGFEDQLIQFGNQANNVYDRLFEKFSKKGQKKKLKSMFGDDLADLKQRTRVHDTLMAQLTDERNALQAVKDERDAYVKSLFEAVVAIGNPTSIGAKTYDGIVRGMRKAAEQAVKFKDTIAGLMNAGLNQATLKQILAAGPEAGLATAQAILAGGVSQINSIQSEIESAASGVSDAAGTHLFGGLVDAAQADVDALIRQLAPLQAQIEKFATNLVKALRDQLDKEVIKLGLGDVKGGGGNGTKGSKPRSGLTASQQARVDHLQVQAANGNKQAKTLIYNAAPNKSLSDEDLFEALKKSGAW